MLLITAMICLVVGGFVYTLKENQDLADVREQTRILRLTRQAVMETNAAIVEAMLRADERLELTTYQRALQRVEAAPVEGFPRVVAFAQNQLRGQEVVEGLITAWTETSRKLRLGQFTEARAVYQERRTQAFVAAYIDAVAAQLAGHETEYANLQSKIEIATIIVLVLQVGTGVLCVLA